MTFFVQSQNLTQKCYLNVVPQLQIPVPCAEDFGQCLVDALNDVLSQRPVVPLHRHVPRILYLDMTRFRAGLIGWKSHEERRLFLIPGWYIGTRYLINLHRKIDTLPEVEARLHEDIIHSAAARDVLELWPDKRSWTEARKRTDLCRLIALAKEHNAGLTHLTSAKSRVSIDFLEGRWGQINDLWRYGSGC
jgi:hypothetical protein